MIQALDRCVISSFLLCYGLFSRTPFSPAACRCIFPPWITSSSDWRLNSSLYLRAILLFTVAFILLCALVSAKLGEVHGSFLHCFHYYSLSSSLALLTHPVCIDLGPAS